MSFWTAVVVIVAIIAYANIRRNRYHGQWQAPDIAQPDSERRELEREVIELRRRVEVLERIITDNRGTHDLAREIESLRER
jgi:hypothetical protein